MQFGNSYTCTHGVSDQLCTQQGYDSCTNKYLKDLIACRNFKDYKKCEKNIDERKDPYNDIYPTLET